MRAVFTPRFADGLGSALGHVLEMTPDLLFSAAKFPEALLDILDRGAASAASTVSSYCSMGLRLVRFLVCPFK